MVFARALASRLCMCLLYIAGVGVSSGASYLPNLRGMTPASCKMWVGVGVDVDVHDKSKCARFCNSHWVDGLTPDLVLSTVHRPPSTSSSTNSSPKSANFLRINKVPCYWMPIEVYRHWTAILGIITSPGASRSLIYPELQEDRKSAIDDQHHTPKTQLLLEARSARRTPLIFASSIRPHRRLPPQEQMRPGHHAAHDPVRPFGQPHQTPTSLA